MLTCRCTHQACTKVAGDELEQSAHRWSTARCGRKMSPPPCDSRPGIRCAAAALAPLAARSEVGLRSLRSHRPETQLNCCLAFDARDMLQNSIQNRQPCKAVEEGCLLYKSRHLDCFILAESQSPALPRWTRQHDLELGECGRGVTSPQTQESCPGFYGNYTGYERQGERLRTPL